MMFSKNYVFVFSSNLSLVHADSTALHAVRYLGARNGINRGACGNTYAIPTRDEHMLRLPLARIQNFVRGFIDFAELHPQKIFQLTKIGCGPMQYNEVMIAPFFFNAPENCLLPAEWAKMRDIFHGTNISTVAEPKPIKRSSIQQMLLF